MATLNNVKFLSLPQQVEQNRKNIEYLETMYNQIFTTQLAIQGQTSILIANLTNIEHKPVVGDILYGSDAYYAQITRVGESVVEFVVIGEMPTVVGPQGPQGDTGPQGPQGPQGIPGEVQLDDLPHINLAMPILAGMTEISTGIYRIYDNNGITIDYNVNNGIYTINGTSTREFGNNGLFDNTIVNAENDTAFTLSRIDIQNAPAEFIILVFNTVTNSEVTSVFSTKSKTTFTITPSQDNIFGIYVFDQMVFNNYQFKLQLEKGSRETTYTIPGQVPQYATKKQEEWITPTLLNGWVNLSSGYTPMRYMKDSLGFVHVIGTIKSGTGATTFNLPSGYRPSHTIIDLAISNGAAIRCDIYGSSGAVQLIGLPTLIDYASINITFKAV